ncbi:MAG TPA: 50S ribosomal protein L15 [Dehalococcoidia bacterium]|nr:50S ribosomal protein L15 [Dehalococcoidia bacterium]
MRPHELKAPRGARHKRKRLGRGNASGTGTYSGKGLKGQKARSGNDIRPGFEGGQLPLILRLGRKRGFTNRFRKEYAVVNLATLERLDLGTDVTVEALRERGVVKRSLPIKVLGNGELTRKLNVTAHRVSASARSKIEKAGGSVSLLEKDDNQSSSSTESAD